MSTTDNRSLTIPSFCAKHGFSRAQFYVLAKRGEAPRTYNIGKLVRISPEADDAWTRQQEAAKAARAFEAA